MKPKTFRVVGSMPRWVRDRTVVRCFDADGHEVAALDGDTGLAWVLDGDEWSLDESVLPPGPWRFDGIYLFGYGTGGRVPTAVTLDGVADNDGSGYAEVVARLEALTESPWDYTAAPRIFARWGQRQDRITTCRACPFFDHAEGACTLDGSFMVTKTIDAAQECPDGRWGVTDDFDAEEAERRSHRSVVMAPTVGPLEGQDEFDAEWEAHRAGR